MSVIYFVIKLTCYVKKHNCSIKDHKSIHSSTLGINIGQTAFVDKFSPYFKKCNYFIDYFKSLVLSYWSHLVPNKIFIILFISEVPSKIKFINSTPFSEVFILKVILLIWIPLKITYLTWEENFCFIFSLISRGLKRRLKTFNWCAIPMYIRFKV